MMSKAKQIGTRAETALVKYLQSVGYKDVHRVVLHGSKDVGDIHIGASDCPLHMFEVKSRDHECSYKEIEEFMEELATEDKNLYGENVMSDHPTSFLIVKRPGKGKVEDWWCCWFDTCPCNYHKDIIVRARVGDVFRKLEM